MTILLHAVPSFNLSSYRAAENLNLAFSVWRSSSSFNLAFKEVCICNAYLSPSYGWHINWVARLQKGK